VVGEQVRISADILADGHDCLAARVRWRFKGSQTWSAASMREVGDDRWEAQLVPEAGICLKSLTRNSGDMSGVDELAQRSLRWKMMGLVVFGVSAVLLASMGGAIVAAPVTIPLIVVASRRHPTVAFRAVGAVLVGLTAGEVVWALTYLAIEEAKPWIWLLPLVVALPAAVAVLGASSRSVVHDHWQQTRSLGIRVTVDPASGTVPSGMPPMLRRL
jgi:hypothetical protein